MLPCNHEIVRAWLAVQTQWDYAGQVAMPRSLDYARVESALRLMRIKRKRQPEIFAGLRIMEAEALPVMQRKIREQVERNREHADSARNRRR